MNISSYETQFTRMHRQGDKSPTINTLNRKPYRTASQKAAAKANTSKTKDGYYRSTAPVSFHR